MGVATLYVDLIASSIKMAPRALASFEVVSVKLPQLAAKMCGCSRGATRQALQVTPLCFCVVVHTNELRRWSWSLL